MANIKEKAQVAIENKELSSIERPLYKSQEAPSPITGTLPETPKRPPRI